MSEIQLFQNLLEFVFCLVDIYLLYMFSATLYKHRFKSVTSGLLIAFASVILFVLGYFEVYSSLTAILHFVLLIVFVQFLFKGPWLSKAVLSLLYYIVIGIVTVVVSSLLSIVLQVTIGTHTNDFSIRIINMVLIKAVMVILLYIMNRRFKNLETNGVSTKHFLVYLLIVLLVLILTFEVLFLQNEGISSVLVVIIFAVFVGIFAISLIILFRYYANREKMSTMELLIKEATIRRDADIQSMKSQVEVMKLKHDLKNHFLALRSLLESNDNEKARQYIDQLTSHPAMKSYVHSRNDIINAILNAKISEHLEIAFKVRHDEGAYVIATDVLTIILGNALDNAIEALEDYDGDSKEIIVTLSENEQYCKIFISNPMTHIPTLNRQQELLSSKRENSVGFGMMNMQEAVDKQGGYLEYRILENQFELIVLLEK